MPFLGNTPANTFVSIAKQTITGNGGTAYTLSYPVTNANEIDVFFNNVRQEPGVAYTASATTITFSEAITSTDSVYVIFNGQAVGTINPSVGSVGLSTLDTNTIDTRYFKKSGDTVNGTLTVKDSTGVDTYLNISSTGRVTTPSQPMFFIRKTGSQSVGNGTTVTFDTTITNVGSHYSTSTNRFTAPVAGNYCFSAKTWMNRNGLAWATLDVFVNGSQVPGAGAYYDSAINNTGNANYLVNIVYPLNTGDYIEFRIGCAAGSIIIDNSGYFCGYLLG